MSHYLCSVAGKGKLDVVQQQILEGANVNLADEDGVTPLYSAAHNGHVACVKLLLESGADVNRAKKYGWTPLNTAVDEGHQDCVKLLLEGGANVDFADEDGWTPLSRAASKGHEACVKLLLEKGASTDLSNKDGSTPLYMAVSRGHLACVNLLLESGANLNLANIDGWTPLNVAASNDRVVCLKMLLEVGANVDLANKYGSTPLCRAACNGHVDCLKLLLQSGANVDLTTKDGRTPLSLAYSNHHVDCVKSLLEGGANVDLATQDGQRLLFWVSAGGHLGCMNLLLKGCPTVDFVDDRGRSSIFLAVSNGHAGCVKLLLERGANVTCVDEEGRSLLFLAASKGFASCVKALLEVDAVNSKQYWDLLTLVTFKGHVDCLSIFLECSAHVNLAVEDWQTLFCAAVSQGYSSCMKLLLKGVPNVDFEDNDGRTSLHEASSKGRIDCLKILLEGGSNVDFVDKDGWTSLRFAIVKDHVGCLILLLEAGANIDLVDKDGWTPLYWALSNGRMDCVNILVDRGANVDFVNKDGDSLLLWAISNGRVDCVKKLLEGGANVELANRTGSSPFAIALSKKHSDCVVQLIAFGAKVNFSASLFSSNPYTSRDKEGKTALHIAVERKRPKRDVLPIILAYPKAVDIRDNNGKTPLDIAFQCGVFVSVLWLLFQYQNDINSNIKEAYPLLYAATRMTRRTIQSVHVHLIGHGYAGKTTCRLALNKTLKHLNPIKFGMFGDHKDVSVDRSSGSGKTEGMEMDSIESPHHKWLIRDYGGQEDFHVNHARFLSVPGSIYVIVVALWDAEKQCRFSVEEIKNRYLYWLKFLNSIAVEGTTMNCITVINFGETVGKEYTSECFTLIKQGCAEWQSSSSSVHLFADPLVLAANKVIEVRQINELLRVCADSAKEINTISVLDYINAIETLFEDCVGQKQRKLTKQSEFKNTVCYPAVCSLLSINSLSAAVEHADLVCDNMIEYLCASGKIIVVPTSISPDDPLIVLDVNWLSNKLLGNLIERMAQSGGDEFIFSANEINDLTENGSQYFGGIAELVLFLESIGACIVVKSTPDTLDTKRWFPLCGQRKFVIGQECIPLEKAVWVSFRRVVRLFKLSDPDHQMFPPGYFIDLFLKILSLFSLGSAKLVKVFVNGLHIEYQFDDAVLQVLLLVLDDNTSFTLEVSYASRIAVAASRNEFWSRFKQIIDQIQHPKEVFATHDIIRVSPWFDNVRLTEMFVNPVIKGTTLQDRFISFAREVKLCKSLADLQARDRSLQNLYIYGCDETDMPVDEKDPPRHILETILGKLDKIQQQLRERWNTVTVTVSSDLIQESFNAMMTALKGSMSRELHDMIEFSRQAISQDSLSVSQMQSVVDNLRSVIGETITSENAQVLTELSRVQESIMALTDEVHNIQHLNEKALQSVILKALDESKVLIRIDNMMHTVVKGTSDVPTMAIVIPVVKKGSLPASFNPSNWTSNEYSLYFVCSHSHQVVACGPDGKGYRFRRAKEWFKKVAPVIKLCLIAAKIALTISGIPIPVSGVVDSLDQITAVAETAKYLNTALSVVDAASDTASTLGVAVGDQGSGVDDKSVDNAEQYVKSLEGRLKQSDTIEAYKSLKALLDEVDPTLSSVGVEKMTSGSGKTGWVKKGDQAVKDSFMRDEKWPMKIDELKESYSNAVTASSGSTATSVGQSRLGARSGLWLPKYLFGRKEK